MTIEEKARAYDEALKRAIKHRNKDGLTLEQYETIDIIFPELVESEDERIRKALIENFELLNGKQFKNQKWGAHEELLIDDILAWLEKQGEQKPNPYSGTSFEYNGHTWGMCVRDNGVDILCDKHIIGHLEKQGESYTKKDVADLNEFVKEYSFNIPSDIYNFLPKEKQSKWINEIESAVRAGVQWFEKQGEQKSSDEILKIRQEVYQSGYNDGYKHGCEDTKNQDEQKSQRMISAEAKEAMYDKPSDKVEPKFKVGDWVVYYRNDSSREVLQVYDIRDGRYYFTDNVHFSWSVKECDEKSHLWTIEDARDGDVLACENGWTCIFKCLNDNLFSSYCFMDHEGWFCEDGGQGHTLDNRICGEIYPATNEQCDTLIKAMADAGYTFDFDKRELKKIEQKSAEWSEEDEKKFADACIMLDWYKGNNWWTAQYIKDWLKSLKDRYTWKPSDAQMASIICAVRKMKESACYDSELVSLLNDLKKLREE